MNMGTSISTIETGKTRPSPMLQKTDATDTLDQDMLLLARLLHFSDSTMPVGSFAFSNGLESAVQTGVVSNADDLLDFVRVATRQAAHMDGIAALHAHRAAASEDFEAVLQADAALWASRIGAEQCLMLARMGKKQAELALRFAPFPLLEQLLAAIKSGETPGTFPIAQALALTRLGASEAQIFTVHQYSVTSMILSAAVRLMRIDHLQTQSILFTSQKHVSADYRDVRHLSLDEMSNFAPVFDILVAQHVKAHVRLFMN